MAPTAFTEVAVVLHPLDNVAILKRAVKPGDEWVREGARVSVLEAVPVGHKLALTDLSAGEVVVKYGQRIGVASLPIRAGSHVHTHNLALESFRPQDWPRHESARIETPLAGPARTFQGYPRADGRVGTRNYIAIIASVNCSASVAAQVRDYFRTPAFKQDYPNVDGMVALTHPSGCGIDPGEPRQLLDRVLAGMACHPNISGFVLVGLGCELNQVENLRRLVRPNEMAAMKPGEPFFINIQPAGGVRKTVARCVEASVGLLRAANDLRRAPQPIGKLVLAENCGGSDAHSGITANPALGVAADLLVGHGATVVLGETPEIYGAEHLLTCRAETPEIAEQLLERVRWWEAHARRHGCTLDNNPSPGNKAGGLTNIVEKSLGAVAKAGQSPLRAVYRYAERISSPGLCFMDTPGFDPVSMTGLVAGGCNIGVFTTGRGSVYGCKPAPCLKVASNTALFDWMNDDMDLNAGTILDGAETVEQAGHRIFESIVAVASGAPTRSELAGMGDEEFAPWQLGPTF